MMIEMCCIYGQVQTKM